MGSKKSPIGSGKNWQLPNIISTLSDVKNDWIQRKEWLKRIQVYWDHDPKSLSVYLSLLFIPLNKQILDLRSSIIREGWDAIIKLANTYSSQKESEEWDHIQNLINQFISVESLIKQLNSGNKTISMIINDWISTILKTNIWSKFVSNLLECGKVLQNPFVSSCMANYLKIYLQTHPIEIINCYFQKLENAFEILLTDKSLETRKNAREAFELFKKDWPMQANKIWLKLPSNILSSISNINNVSSNLTKANEEPNQRHFTVKVKKATINISGEDNFYEEFKDNRSPHINKIKQSIEISKVLPWSESSINKNTSYKK